MTLIIDKKTLEELRPKINAALAIVHPDLQILLGNIRFQSDSFEAKIEARVKATDTSGKTVTINPYAKNLPLMVKQYKIENADKPSNDGYTLVGYNYKRPKKCWIIKKGLKEFICTDADVGARWKSVGLVNRFADTQSMANLIGNM